VLERDGLPTLKEVLGPLISAAKHVFMKPYTIKYPYEKVPGMLEENYRYDPKAGIAYPGTKGRHLLRMEKCTGCSLCDIACQNIAEAITMVYAYDLFLDVPDELFKEYGDPSSPVTGVAAAVADALAEVAEVGEVKYGYSHPVMPVLPDLKTVTKSDGFSSVRLVIGPVWARGIDFLVFSYLEGAFRALQRSGYGVALVEDQSPDKAVYEVSKDGKAVRIRIEKRNMNIPVNKKSYFPSVDYGRCVFCGFCVDACPFYALEMTPDFELSSLSRQGLVYFPTALASPKVSTPPPTINPIDAIMGWLRRKLF
jgi:NADH-quinone oxidoreductase subunit I